MAMLWLPTFWFLSSSWSSCVLGAILNESRNGQFCIICDFNESKDLSHHCPLYICLFLSPAMMWAALLLHTCLSTMMSPPCPTPKSRESAAMDWNCHAKSKCFSLSGSTQVFCHSDENKDHNVLGLKKKKVVSTQKELITFSEILGFYFSREGGTPFICKNIEPFETHCL